MHRLRRGDLHTATIADRVLTGDLRSASGSIVLRKGQVLQAEDARSLEALPWSELHLIEPEPGDLHEDAAGRRLVQAVQGCGVEVGEFGGGAWPLYTRWRGILDVDVERLRSVNRVDGMSVYTLYSGQVVDARECVARAKIVPLVLAEARVREAESAAAGEIGTIAVRPFHPTTIGAVVRDTLNPRQRERFRASLGEKIAWFGSTLREPVHVDASAQALVAALAAEVEGGAGVVVLAGSKPMDPLDPTFDALARLGAAVKGHGVPAHPGSLFWIARLGEMPILGMPGCGLFSQATVFDLVLPRILAGERVGRAELAELGHGGFLTREMAFRFPPYRPARERGAIPPES
jgi:hypothetical protein